MSPNEFESIERQRDEADGRRKDVEARLHGVLQSALDCIILIDGAGVVVEWNPAASATFGFEREHAVGRPLANLIIPLRFREEHRLGLERFVASGDGPVLNKRLELFAVRRTGEEFPVELTITPIPNAIPPMFSGFLRDISDRKQKEVEREELLESERAARAEAEHAGRMKDEFLATLSHELRTPLNAITAWVHLLRNPGGDAARLAEGLQVIERNARAQTQIIEDILDMSRIISGKLRLDVQRIDLAKAVRAAVETLQPAADAKNLRLITVLDPAAGPITGDPNRLQQILWNLLSNAVKFTPKGGRIQVLLERVNSHVEVSIIDTGEGIDPEFLPNVFDRFRQADATTTRRHGGLGLGLSIVKQLVEMHGGTVRVKSAGKGTGATFVIVLPLAVVHADPAEKNLVREHPESHTTAEAHRYACEGLKGVSVIVVDDEPDGRAVVKRLLEECGALVRTAGSADAALKLIADQVPKVVISDIGMPDQDGYAFIRKVRTLSAERGGRVRAIALTAYARSLDRIRAMEAGFHLHLPKPVDPVELVVAVAAMSVESA